MRGINDRPKAKENATRASHYDELITHTNKDRQQLIHKPYQLDFRKKK